MKSKPQTTLRALAFAALSAIGCTDKTTTSTVQFEFDPNTYTYQDGTVIPATGTPNAPGSLFIKDPSGKLVEQLNLEVGKNISQEQVDQLKLNYDVGKSLYKGAVIANNPAEGDSRIITLPEATSTEADNSRRKLWESRAKSQREEQERKGIIPSVAI